MNFSVKSSDPIKGTPLAVWHKFHPTATSTKTNSIEANWLSLTDQTGNGDPLFKFTHPPRINNIQNPKAAHWRL